MTTFEEGALEELPRIDVIVDDKYTHNNAMMEDPRETTPIDRDVDEEVRPKELPRVDVDIDEDNIDTEGELSDQEAPVPEPFDLDDDKRDKDEEKLKQEATVLESEQTAENGWIVILQNPEVPYDQDADPAGLYGGKEVDDRPTLLEFYHQNARTNGHFAKMAPTRAELAAETVAARLAEAESKAEEAKLEASRSAFSKQVALPPTLKGASIGRPGILKLGSSNGDSFPQPNRNYGDVLTGRSPALAPSNKANALPSRSIANVSFAPGTKTESAKEKVMNVFHKWQIANNAKANENAQIDCWKALRLELEERDRASRANTDDGGPLQRTKSIKYWVPDPNDKTKRVLHLTNPDLEEDDDADDEQDMAMPSLEVDDDADSVIAQGFVEDDHDPELAKAIAASLAQCGEVTQGKGKVAADLKENMNPDARRALDTSIAAEIQANADFHKQFAEVDRSRAMLQREKARKNAAIIDASIAEEEADIERDNAAIVDVPMTEEDADLQRAMWESMKGSPVKKRKSSTQSPSTNDGLSEESGAGKAGRGWTPPKGSEQRSHKRCKRVPRGEATVEESNTHAVLSPRKGTEE